MAFSMRRAVGGGVRITADDVVERLDRHAGERGGWARAVLVAAALVIGVLDGQLGAVDVAVLLWVPLVAAATLLGRVEGLAAVVVAVVVGIVTLPAGAATQAVIAVEAVGRAIGLAAVAGATAWTAELARELVRRSRLDPLTSLLNRSGFAAALERERSRAQRSGTPLSLVYVDLDGLKQANDRFGHARGDELLVRFALHLDGSRRSVDVAARLSGDEFALLLPDTDAAGTTQLLERLFVTVHADPRCLPASAGAVTWSTDLPPSSEMLRAADDAMYGVKRRGGSAWTVIDLRAPEGPSRPAPRPAERR